jgi:hypothetical protein
MLSDDGGEYLARRRPRLPSSTMPHLARAVLHVSPPSVVPCDAAQPLVHPVQEGLFPPARGIWIGESLQHGSQCAGYT